MRRLRLEDADLGQPSRLPMGPMIDVVFLLLVFFLCTMEFRSLEGKLGAFLPKGFGPGPVEEVLASVEIRMEVAAEGRRVPVADPSRTYAESIDGSRFEFSGREIRYGVGTHRTSDFETLREWLREQVNVARRPTGEPRPALLQPDPGVLNEEVVRVLDAAWETGFREIVFRGG